MVYSSENVGCSTLSNNKSVAALETTLHQSINHLKELVIEFDQLQLEAEDYKTQVLTLKGKCEGKICVGSVALKKVVELKDNIIQSVASALTRLNETKDMSIIDEAFKILCGETVSLTPPKDSADFQLQTPKKEMSPSFTEMVNDESVSEIEGTPTGRTSPIIVSRKARNAASDHREKKKCPDNWATPKSKALKLTYPAFCTPTNKTGKSKLRQTRFTTVKQTSVLDISSSPEFAGLRGTKDTKSMQLNIKKESLDDEDTIQPSPTSITCNFSSIYRCAVTSSPLKLNKNSPNKIAKGSPAKPSLVKKTSNTSKLLIKTEGPSNVENVEYNLKNPDIKIKMEDSINLLRPPRFQTPDRSPLKLNDPDETECNIDSSMSLLQHIDKMEKVSPANKNICSPTKRPLAENINLTNLQTQCDTEASMSLLNNKHFTDIKKDLERTPNKNHTFEKDAKNPALETIAKILERSEPIRENDKVDAVFKEPTVRKKAEKRALPGWSCDECKNFYAELYKNDPEMLAKKMDECSKHRGRQNPARPKTPPGFWYPRWDVPEDTEEFNKRNNAV